MSIRVPVDRIKISHRYDCPFGHIVGLLVELMSLSVIGASIDDNRPGRAQAMAHDSRLIRFTVCHCI